MPKIHEIIDSLTDENVEELKEQLKSEADALASNNKQLYVRAKKAEGFEQNEEGNWVKVEKPEPKKEPESPESKVKNEDPKPQTSNEPDYAKLAFLKAEGVTHPDDQQIVQDEANRLKLPLTDVLKMEHIKSILSKNSIQREADAGTPDKKGKSGNSSQGDVEYWIDKVDENGNYANPDDLELYEKVSNARMLREEKAGMFEPIR